MNQKNNESFIELLDQNYSWPDYFVFKFIFHYQVKDEVLSHLDGFEIEIKESKNGNYLSISARKIIHHSNEVLVIYERVSQIKGVMSL